MIGRQGSVVVRQIFFPGLSYMGVTPLFFFVFVGITIVALRLWGLAFVKLLPLWTEALSQTNSDRVIFSFWWFLTIYSNCGTGKMVMVAKGIFFCIHDCWLEESEIHCTVPWICHFKHNYNEIHPFLTFSHCCQEKYIICSDDSWLQSYNIASQLVNLKVKEKLKFF